MKGSAQRFLCDQTSSSPYSTLVSAISISCPVSLTLFWLPFLVRAKVSQPCTGAQTCLSRVGHLVPADHTGTVRASPAPDCYVMSGFVAHGHLATLSLFTVFLRQQLPSKPPPFRKTWVLVAASFVMQCSLTTVPSAPSAHSCIREDMVLMGDSNVGKILVSGNS